MNWRLLQTVCLTIALTAFAFEGFSTRGFKRMLIAQSFCDTFGGTWMGYFCPREPVGGGSSGAE